MIPKDQISEVLKNLNGDNCKSDIEKVFTLPVDQPSDSDALAFAYLVHFMLNCLEEHNYIDNEVNQEDVIKLLLRY